MWRVKHFTRNKCPSVAVTWKQSELPEVDTYMCFLLEQRNVMRKQRNWEKQLAAKKSKRKEEKQRRKLNREQQPGAMLLWFKELD